MKKKSLFVCLMLTLLCCGLASAQDERGNMPPREPQRPTAYELANEVRKDLNLSDKEYSSVHSAYEKFLKSIFGDDSAMLQRPQGNRSGGPGGPGGPGGHGGPGGPGGHGGPGGNGGMGGPGGMPPQSGGFGDPSGNFDGGQSPRKAPSMEMTEDMEKFQKTVKKADEKLCKSIKKVFKKSPEKYDQWMKIKQRQMPRILPMPPRD